MLNTIVNKQQYLNSSEQRMVIEFNGELLDYHKEFFLYMATSDSSPPFEPEVFIKTNVINFTVSQKGLEEQLLAEVMRLENPDIETQKNENIERISTHKKKLAETEGRILRLLAECQQSPVEDETLVQSLETAKLTSREIKDKLEQIDQLCS